MQGKKHNYKLDDAFVEECVTALAMQSLVNETRYEGETQEEADKRLAAAFSERKCEYRLKFLQC